MSYAARMTALVAVVAAAINARSGLVGASTYDLYVLNGGTMTLNDWLSAQQGSATAAVRQSLSGPDLWNGRELTDPATGITWRYLKANTTVGTPSTPAGWREWESDWIGIGINMLSGFAGGYSATNGWISSHSMIRFRGGKVGFRGNVIVNGGGAVNAMICLELPYLASSPMGAPYTVPLGVTRPGNGNQYALLGEINHNSKAFWLGYPQSGGAVQGTSPTGPLVWAQSDTIAWDFEFSRV